MGLWEASKSISVYQFPSTEVVYSKINYCIVIRTLLTTVSKLF